MLMKRSQQEMADIFKAQYVSLHVRKSNRAAFHLYTKTLKYEVHDIEKGYYANGEDAYDMRCYFRRDKSDTGDKEDKGDENDSKNDTTISNDPAAQDTTITIQQGLKNITLEVSET